MIDALAHHGVEIESDCIRAKEEDSLALYYDLQDENENRPLPLANRDTLAVQAVFCERVSNGRSLLTGRNTGKGGHETDLAQIKILMDCCVIPLS